MRAVLILSVVAVATSLSRAESYDLSLPPKDGEKYKSADFRIWIPDGVKTVRAVIVRQHGCGRNGSDHSDDLQWQALAKKHDAALLGPWYQYHKECAEWFDPKNGTERAFLEALKRFSVTSQHPELEQAPWAIWGHSGGSMWACHMANRHPDRVVAVWARSQAVTEYTDAALLVPIVFNYGEGEKVGRFESVHKNSVKAFETYRPKGALWAIAVDPKSSHDCRENRTLAVPFFDQMLTERLPANGAGKLLPLHPQWVGDLKTLRIQSHLTAPGDQQSLCWLPGEAFAKKWVEYCQTGTVKDTTPPPAPTQVVATKNDTGVSLKWQAAADLESGLKAFHVYRDGKKIATVGSDKSKGNPNGFVQIWNYGDEPEPKAVRFGYTDIDGTADATYTVTSENHAGLESSKSSVGAVSK